jgi:protein TonB
MQEGFWISRCILNEFGSAMLKQEQPPGRPGWSLSHPVSIALHCVVLAVVLLSRPKPVFVRPSSVLHGDHGTSLVYLAPKMPGQTVAMAPRKEALTFNAPARVMPSRDRDFKPQEPEKLHETETASASAGSPSGSVSDGPATGVDVRPAIPTVFPDPPNLRSAVPSGVQGDVIVEITIDAQGNVIETKLLKTVGYGLEEKIITTLQNWRFRPATRDGVAIPSKQNVLYHFPS